VGRVVLRVDLGADVGQNLGTLFEARDAHGKVVAGAGFLGDYNTQDRGDRRLLHAYVKVPEAEQFALEPLPRPAEDAGTYLFGFGNRLFAKGRGGVDAKLRVWNPERGEWEVDEATIPFSVAVADGTLAATQQQVTFEGQPLVDAVAVGGRLAEPYYAGGVLVLRNYDPAASPPRNELVACDWRPGGPAPDWDSAKRQPLSTPTQFIYAYGQLGGQILAVSNAGGVFALADGEWRVLRESVPTVSYQVYSMLNFRESLLLGHYPSGEVLEFDGHDLRQLFGWPPVMPGVRREAREAQTLAIYGGDVYAGVWPWGEIWRHNPNEHGWQFLGRMFTHPAPTDTTTHPYENETRAIDPVLNRWGQRVTSLVPWGDSLYISTSAKSSAPYEAKFDFLAGDKWREYGAVYRHRRPGCLAVPFRWTKGPTTFDFRWDADRLRIEQDGQPLGETAWPAPAEPLAAPARLETGMGVFGRFAGKLSVEAETSVPRKSPFLAAYVDLQQTFDRNAPIADRQRSMETMLDSARESGLTTLMPFANTSSGSVYYPSQIVSRQVCPDWDPLGYFMSAARRRGLQVWPAICVLASGHFEPRGIVTDHPGWALRQADGRPWGFISPAHPEAQAWLVAWIDELVSRYEPDGLLLDYLRYFNRPWQLDAAAAEALERDLAALGDVDEATRQRFRQARAEEHLTELMDKIRQGTRTRKADLKIGVYTWGPHVAQNHLVAQPWPAWVATGQIDLVNVSGYYYRTQNGDGYRKLLVDRLRQAIDLSRAGSPTVPVTFALGMHTSHGSLQLAGEIDEYLQDAAKAGIDGVALFTWSATEPFLDELNKAQSVTRFAQAVSEE
jgi:hypothetical protein